LAEKWGQKNENGTSEQIIGRTLSRGLRLKKGGGVSYLSDPDFSDILFAGTIQVGTTDGRG
jgi:hypothetical protein